MVIGMFEWRTRKEGTLGKMETGVFERKYLTVPNNGKIPDKERYKPLRSWQHQQYFGNYFLLPCFLFPLFYVSFLLLALLF
jgi:hypothetical protein